MIKRIVIVLLILMISIMGSAHAQESTGDIVSVSYSKSGGIADSYVQDFMERFEANLTEYNIALNILDEYTCCASNSAILIAFGTSNHAPFLPYINIRTNSATDPLSSKSSLLRLPSNYYNALSPDEQTVAESFINLATGIGLYVISRCDIADQFFEKSEMEGITTQQTIDMLVSRGDCALLKGNFTKAVDFFKNATIVWDEAYGYVPFEISLNLAWAEIQLGQMKVATETAANAIYPQEEIDWSYYSEQLEKTAEVYALASDYEGAISYMTESMNQYGDSDATGLAHRAQFYALAEHYDDAIADLNTAIELTPENPELYTLRGQMYLYLYEWDNVLADYNKAIELNPTYADAYFLRGVLYYSILQTGAENYPLALADFQRYLELVPDGDHAADAQTYADQIQTQQEALDQ